MPQSSVLSAVHGVSVNRTGVRAFHCDVLTLQPSATLGFDMNSPSSLRLPLGTINASVDVRLRVLEQSAE